MPIKDNHIDIGLKIIEMGESLKEEGDENKDAILQQTGDFLILVGDIMGDETDMDKFAVLVNMFSSQRVVDTMIEQDKRMKKYLDIKDSKETFDEMLKKLSRNKCRDGFPPYPPFNPEE